MNNNSKQPSLLQSRLKLIFVIMLFLGPLLGAFVWYYGFGANLAPRGQSNHAPLIQPAVPLQAFDNALLEGNVNLQSLERFWTVVHLLNRQCDAGCEKALYNTRQTRIAVGKDGNRIQRFIISANAALLKQLENEHSDAKLVMEKGGTGRRTGTTNSPGDPGK